MSAPAYHASLADLGSLFIFDEGGYYEQIRDDGTPVQRTFGGGFTPSDTPELAASTRPEAATFAAIKNFVNETGDAAPGGEPLTISIYALESSPDIDCSDAIAGDFHILDEVRYRRPAANPVPGSRLTRLTLPGRVTADVELAYLPCRAPEVNSVITRWATAVQRAIRTRLYGYPYPDDISRWAGIDRPNPEAYGPAYPEEYRSANS